MDEGCLYSYGSEPRHGGIRQRVWQRVPRRHGVFMRHICQLPDTRLDVPDALRR